MSLKFKHHQAFTLMEMMISMVVIAILMAASMPMISQFSTFKTGVDKNVMKCITNNSSSSWFTDATGVATVPATEPCRAAVVDTQYNRGRAYNTAAWYAGTHGTSAQQLMAKKILRTACDQGGEKACDYFINYCQTNGSGSAPYCDDTANFLDVTYYLHQNKNTNTNNGATYIYNQLETLLPKMLPNFVNEVFYACVNNQTPNDNQNLSVNLACELAKPRIYIQACNAGNTGACVIAYNNNYNRSCKQVKTAWSNAPTGNYSLTYNSSGDYETVNCNMSSMASASITGCNAATANLLGNAPYDDCTYAHGQGYNQTCPVIFANWSTAPTGTYNLTTNGAPPTALVSDTCTYSPPNHAACMASGIGTICSDGTVYAGDSGGRHLFITQTNEPGTYTWSNGVNGLSTGATNSNNGLSNYNTLIGLSNVESPYMAANACKSLNNGPNNYGHTDWYLPARNELNLLYDNRASIGNFLTVEYYGMYYSSTEYNSSSVCMNYFFNGSACYTYESKHNAYKVRCIRSANIADVSCPNIGNTCADNTKYAGYIDSRYIFTTSADELGTYSWNKGIKVGFVNTGATDLDYGMNNQNKLIAATDSGAPYKAANACKLLNEDIARNKGYTDWYLPAVNEANVIYIGKAAGLLLNFIADNYWTSTDQSDVYAKYKRFSDGNQSGNGKFYASYVRCIRSE